MADFTTGPVGSTLGIPTTLQAGIYVNIAAAMISLALIGGVGVWGYKLLMRDVTGVPVVRALVGEMRVSPENPGGEIANHMGLSVNSVSALGGAAEPEDRLVLAPSNVSLKAEDLNVISLDKVDEVTLDVQELLGDTFLKSLLTDEIQPSDKVLRETATLGTPIDPSVPLTIEDVLSFADQIATGGALITNLGDDVDLSTEIAVNDIALNFDIISDAVSGVRRSVRPKARDSSMLAAIATLIPVDVNILDVAAPITGEVSTVVIPVGTKLVQLGAFDNANTAASEWVNVVQRFPDFFDDKEKIIQEALSGGRSFFRLRAMGFTDLSDARRFCSALSAEGAACIPVVVR
ncbi:MAG: SPOR domain-containing protein [Octadecabacter sp.]|nr:SPOR domain-containing protein [Octadecabacter sp.]